MLLFDALAPDIIIDDETEVDEGDDTVWTSEADNLLRAAKASGKFGGVTGVLAGVHIYQTHIQRIGQNWLELKHKGCIQTVNYNIICTVDYLHTISIALIII